MSLATAATILLVRPGATGLEVFLVKRHGGSGFMPNAWVFPGGRVEPSDADLPIERVRGGDAALARFGYPEPLGRAVLVGGVRETFEESGIWLGQGALDPASRAPLAAGTLSLTDLLIRTDAVVELDRVHAWARWVTPEGERRRFDTAFLVSVVDEVGGVHDELETVDSGWFRPADVIAAGLHTMGLAPPTWWTLTELAAMADVDALHAAIAARDLTPVQPVLSLSETGFGIVLPGHHEHPLPRRADLPTRIHLGPQGWLAED